MADPRSLHLQGIGKLDKVQSDWTEALNGQADKFSSLDQIAEAIYLSDKGEEIGIAIMACAIAQINSQIRNHGCILRINGDGNITINHADDINNREMLAEYIESI